MLAGVLLMAGFAAWQYLSIAWAGENGQALDGANRTLFYTTVLALFALWPWNPRGARLVLGTFGLGISGIALVQLLKFQADPLPYLNDARFFEPAGYINANVAMWVIATFPCLYLARGARGGAADPGPVPGLRGAAVGRDADGPEPRLAGGDPVRAS